MTTHSSILAWRTPQTESGGLESMGVTKSKTRETEQVSTRGKITEDWSGPQSPITFHKCSELRDELGQEKGKLHAAVHFVMGRGHRSLPLCKGLIETVINIIIQPHTLVSHGSKSTPPGHACPPFCLAFSYTHLLLEGHC